jgi:hypothetical protein
MRCLFLGLVLIAAFCSVGPVAAQVDSPQARQLRAQLEELQDRLNRLQSRDGADRNVTEIGLSHGRSRGDAEPRLVVRIYDLADLYSIAPSYPARDSADLRESPRFVFPDVTTAGTAHGASAVGGMGGGMFAVPSSIRSPEAFREVLPQAAGSMGGTVSDSARTSVNNLIETITSTISPGEWTDAGGPASIKVLGASLIVSAPVDMHDKIAALIDLFRKRWRSLRTISIEAHWLWLAENELASAIVESQKTAVAFGVLSEAAWKGLRALAAARAERIGYHGFVHCYNGQTVNVVAGGQQLVVAGLVPIVGGKDAATAYTPTTRVVPQGAALQVTPIATRTAKFIVADIHSRVTLLDGPAANMQPRAQRPLAAGDPAQIVATLDRPVVRTQQISTTLRLPVGQPTLVGGMTFNATAADDPNLYLFVTGRAQELLDEEAADVRADDGAEKAAKEQEDSPPK